MINKEQIEKITKEATDEIKKFGRTSQKVSKDMINALEQVKNINYDSVLANCKPKKKVCNCPHNQCYAIICTECQHYY